MTRQADNGAALLFEHAAAWVARLQAQDCTPAERQQFEDWLSEDPRHAKAWMAAETLHQRGAVLAADPWVRTAAARAARPRPRRRWPVLATAAGLCLAVGLGGLLYVDGYPTTVVYANTAHAVQRQTLADGSVATLDAGTQLSARFGWRKRELQLDHGRMQLVAAPSWRPLRVQAGDSRIRDIGTIFQVERLADGRVEIALLEGVVEVSSSVAQHTLAPGQQLQVLATGQITPAAQLATDAAEAWPQGRLVFDATPLSTVVERMNRYGGAPLVIADPAIANLAVSGSFRAGDARELLAALQLGWSIAGQPGKDGVLELHDTH